MVDSPLTFGEYLRRLRRERNWSLSDLSKQAGMSYYHLSRLENDSTVPNAETVSKLAETLGADLDRLLELSDCLPRAILNRILARDDEAAGVKLARSAPHGVDSPEKGTLTQKVTRALLDSGFRPQDAATLADAALALAKMDQHQRDAVIKLIHSLSSEARSHER